MFLTTTEAGKRLKPFEIIDDVGGGINYEKKGIQKLVNLVCGGEVEKIVVLYKDRLMRLGVELFKNMCDQFNTAIEIVETTTKTEQEELVEDLVQIITVFSCKLQGKRAKKTREMIKEILNNVQSDESAIAADSGAGEEI